MAIRVGEIWRYPVKSMGGERIDSCTLGALGIPGDRGWALRDEPSGEIRGAKKLPDLMHCRARYTSEPGDGEIPQVLIETPEGDFRSDDEDVGSRLSGFLGREVSLWPRQPAANEDHYRRRPPDDPDFEKELRSIFGRTPDEPLPDLGGFPAEIMEFVSPLGTYFDAFPLHLLTTSSLRSLGISNPKARFDGRRFRPNFVLETDEEGLVEAGWAGRPFRLGEALVRVEMPTVRCIMTTLPQGDLEKDPSVLRTIVAEAEQNVGVYATVVSAGRVSVGDLLEEQTGAE